MGLIHHLLFSQIRTHPVKIRITPEKLSDLPKVTELMHIRLEPRLPGSELVLPPLCLVILLGAGVSKFFYSGPENKCVSFAAIISTQLCL